MVLSAMVRGIGWTTLGEDGTATRRKSKRIHTIRKFPEGRVNVALDQRPPELTDQNIVACMLLLIGRLSVTICHGFMFLTIMKSRMTGIATQLAYTSQLLIHGSCITSQ